MNRKISSLFLMVFLLCSSLFFAQKNSVAARTAEKVEKKEQGFNAKDIIMEHISDANEWHIATLNEGTSGEKEISIPLPVIIKDKDGLHTFLSGSLSHGKELDGYTMENGLVKSTKGLQRAALFSLISGKQNAQNSFFDFSITKNIFAMLLSALVMLLIFIGTARSYKNGVATGVGKFMEPIIVFIRDEVAIPNIGTKKYKKFLPYLLTAFFFIWLNNLLGLIPFFPGGANLTGNIAVTAVLAVITLLITVFSANKEYWKHIFMPPVPYLLYPIMVPIEIIGIFTKPFALMMRLFANVTAGHIMILAIISLIFIFKSAFLGLASVPLALFVSVLELLVAALQAYIFTVLSALFIGIAVADHHHEDGHSAHPEMDSAGDDAAVI